MDVAASSLAISLSAGALPLGAWMIWKTYLYAVAAKVGSITPLLPVSAALAIVALATVVIAAFRGRGWAAVCLLLGAAAGGVHATVAFLISRHGVNLLGAVLHGAVVLVAIVATLAAQRDGNLGWRRTPRDAPLAAAALVLFAASAAADAWALAAGILL
jgi:hypothetical protein